MTGVRAHDQACLASLNTLQGALPGAGNNQAAVNALYITHYRTCLASAKANNCGMEPFIVALKTLTGGV
jgi:hypothetical protein